MGNLYNSDANLVYNIVNFLSILASVTLVATISYAVFKIMTGDEQDHQRYLKRIKNGIIALILILVLNPIIKITNNYFYDSRTIGIGDFSKYAEFKVKDYDFKSALSKEKKDKANREVKQIDNDYYVKTTTSPYEKNFGTWSKPCKYKIDEYKRLEACQGPTSGAFEDVSFYKIVGVCDNEYDSNGSLVGRYLSGDYKNTISKIKDEGDFETLKNITIQEGGSTNGGGFR